MIYAALILLLASSSSCAYYWQQRPADSEHSPAHFMLLLSYAFIAVATLAELIAQTRIISFQGDMVTFKRMLANLAYFAGIPIIIGASFTLFWQKAWSKPTWGRIFLGLFAFFELFRRMDNGLLYAQWLAAFCILLLAANVLKASNIRSKALLFFSTISLASCLLLFGEGSFYPILINTVLYSASLAIGSALLTFALHSHTKWHTEQLTQ